MDYEKIHKETLDNLQVMVNEGKITENVAKRICSDFKLESEDEKIKKALIGYLAECRNNTRSEVMLYEYAKWITWVKKQDTENAKELSNGEDYGIDGMYAAIDILKKTLGKVEGYQSDDGILEHECAISAVKKLYNQKPAEWTDEDEENMTYIKAALSAYVRIREERNNTSGQVELDKARKWLDNRFKLLSLNSKQEWTDEDDEMVEDIIDAIPGTYAVSDYNEMVGWLKEVKKRVKHQEKSEWAKTDK